MTPRLAWAILWAIWCCALHGCANPYVTALKAGATFRATVATTEQVLKDACHVKHLDCIAAHGVQTPAFNSCTDPCIKGLAAFAKYTRPAVNTALIAFVAGVQLAKAIKDKTGLLDLMKPLSCSLVTGAEPWLPLLPASSRETVEAIAAGVKGFVCSKGVP